MRLYAISDLHLLSEINRQALLALPAYPEDWLILAGDIGETEELLRFALSIFTRRFKRVVWVPGNHDLWTLPSDRSGPRGEAKYQRLVSICRDHGVLRADFAINETYIYTPGPPLECSLSAFGGLQDQMSTPAEIEGWRDQTRQAFTLRLLPGDHFFLHSARPRLLHAVVQDLSHSLHRLNGNQPS